MNGLLKIVLFCLIFGVLFVDDYFKSKRKHTYSDHQSHIETLQKEKSDLQNRLAVAETLVVVIQNELTSTIKDLSTCEEHIIEPRAIICEEEIK